MQRRLHPQHGQAFENLLRGPEVGGIGITGRGFDPGLAQRCLGGCAKGHLLAARAIVGVDRSRGLVGQGPRAAAQAGLAALRTPHRGLLDGQHDLAGNPRVVNRSGRDQNRRAAIRAALRPVADLFRNFNIAGFVRIVSFRNTRSKVKGMLVTRLAAATAGMCASSTLRAFLQSSRALQSCITWFNAMAGSSTSTCESYLGLLFSQA